MFKNSSKIMSADVSVTSNEHNLNIIWGFFNQSS